MTNRDLIKQYVDTGVPIPESQYLKLSPNDKKTYLRKRLIAQNQKDDIEKFEFDSLSFDEKLKTSAKSMYVYMNKEDFKNFREEKIKDLPLIVINKFFPNFKLDIIEYLKYNKDKISYNDAIFLLKKYDFDDVTKIFFIRNFPRHLVHDVVPQLIKKSENDSIIAKEIIDNYPYKITMIHLRELIKHSKNPEFLQKELNSYLLSRM